MYVKISVYAAKKDYFSKKHNENNVSAYPSIHLRSGFQIIQKTFIRQGIRHIIFHGTFYGIRSAPEMIRRKGDGNLPDAVLNAFPHESKGVIGQIQHVRIVNCEDKLSALSQTLNHQTEDTLFKVALNIGKVFITVIEAVSAEHHGCEEDSDINTFCRTAGQKLTVQQSAILNDNLLIPAANHKGILQFPGNGNIGQC